MKPATFRPDAMSPLFACMVVPPLDLLVQMVPSPQPLVLESLGMWFQLLDIIVRTTKPRLSSSPPSSVSSHPLLCPGHFLGPDFPFLFRKNSRCRSPTFLPVLFSTANAEPELLLRRGWFRSFRSAFRRGFCFVLLFSSRAPPRLLATISRLFLPLRCPSSFSSLCVVFFFFSFFSSSLIRAPGFPPVFSLSSLS